MGKDEPIVTYLSKFSQVRDELGGVGETIPLVDLVILSLLRLYKSWHNFQDVVNGRDKLPNWEILW